MDDSADGFVCFLVWPHPGTARGLHCEEGKRKRGGGVGSMRKGKRAWQPLPTTVRHASCKINEELRHLFYYFLPLWNVDFRREYVSIYMICFSANNKMSARAENKKKRAQCEFSSDFFRTKNEKNEQSDSSSDITTTRKKKNEQSDLGF